MLFRSLLFFSVQYSSLNDVIFYSDTDSNPNDDNTDALIENDGKDKNDVNHLAENCTDLCCKDIQTTKSIELVENCVTLEEIYLPTPIPKDCLLEVQRHIVNKPWKVLSDFLFEHPITKAISIPLVANETCTILPNEILDHVQVVPIAEAYRQRKGKKLLTFLQFFHYFIYFCILDAQILKT